MSPCPRSHFADKDTSTREGLLKYTSLLVVETGWNPGILLPTQFSFHLHPLALGRAITEFFLLGSTIYVGCESSPFWPPELILIEVSVC